MAAPPFLPAILAVARGALAPNTLAGRPVLKIHPSVGVARVGDAPTAFFIGPEVPLGAPVGADASVGSAVPNFRAGGQIKRQAARFRIFHYPDPLSATAPIELNLAHPEVAAIEWTVHLANRKAAFFQFDGQNGAAGANGPFTDPARRPQLRNPTITAGRNTKLVIDPGPRKIKGAKAGPVKFDAASGGNFPTNVAGNPIISYLGELQTDDQGRLLVLGGRGTSISSNALPLNGGQIAELRITSGVTVPPTGPTRPSAPMLEYANNDTWFDDVSDGPVTAQVTLKSGRKITVPFPAWVLVGPPDFAPGIRHVISLYDTMLDVAVRDLPLPALPFAGPTDPLTRDKLDGMKKSFAGSASTFAPEFFLEIEPTLKAGFLVPFVHDPGVDFHGTLDVATLGALKDPSAASQPIREFVFKRLRPPAGNAIYSGDGSMPKLLGDNALGPDGDPKKVAALPRFQFHVLGLWKDGKFIVGSPGPLGFSAGGLERAALESCVGGAFFPGIECSWLVRDQRVYQEPFRINHTATAGTGPSALKVQPGFFSQQMAQPWQSDFMDCRKDFGTTKVAYGWWPAQRPDDVYKNVTDAVTPRDPITHQNRQVEWHRGVPGPRFSSHANMVALWSELGFVVQAVAPGGRVVFIESERQLPEPPP